METLDVKNADFQELSEKEMQFINGGGMGPIGRGIVRFFEAIVVGASDLGTGIYDGFNDASMQRIIDNSPKIA
jgi:bacteriocin-like protein